MTGPGVRVAVTRDEGTEGELSRALRACGLEPVACPAIVRHAAPDPARLEAAARALERYDWLVAASAHAVDVLCAARGNATWPASLRVAAVGERTAARLRSAGAPAPITADDAGAEALVATLERLGSWRGRRCLLPRALDGGPRLARALRGWGAEVDEVIAYRTEPRPEAEIAAAWRAARPEAAVFASPSAASATIGALGPGTIRSLRAVVAIGPTTRESLDALGVTCVVPERSDFPSVARLLRDLTFDESEVSS